MRLLLVEDDLRIAEPTLAALKEAGYDAVLRADGESGLEEALLGDYPLVILDVMLPRLDGFALARALRESGSRAGLLFLTARAELEDRVTGLDLGGDAYLTKPFALPELLATLRALSRRDAQTRQAVIPFGGGRGQLDTPGHRVRWDGQEVAVTGREYALLELLVLGQGRWFTRDELLDRIWGQEYPGEGRIVDVYVRYLRRKLDQGAVLSERGRGYRAAD